MKVKIFSVTLLACMLVFSSDLMASPLTVNDNNKLLSSFIYQLAADLFGKIEVVDGYDGVLLGGDADDYANGRTEENTKDDLINNAGREDDGRKK